MGPDERDGDAGAGMRRWLLALAFPVVLAQVNCTDVRKTGVSDQEVTSSIGYVRDPRSGICFATLASRTYYGYEVVSFTEVTCEKVPR